MCCPAMVVGIVALAYGGSLAVYGSLAVGGSLQTHMRQAGYVLEDRVLVEFGCIAAGVLIVMVNVVTHEASVLAWALGIVLIVIGTATLVVGLYYDIRYGFDNTTLIIPAVLFSVLLWTLVAYFLHNRS